MSKVRPLQRTLYRKAKKDKGVKFYSLYDKLWREDVLWEAWRQVKANRGAPGVDGASIEAIVSSGKEGEMISRLSQGCARKPIVSTWYAGWTFPSPRAVSARWE